MPGFAQTSLIGAQAFFKDAQFAPPFASGSSSNIPLTPPGMRVTTFDPYWGYAELILAQFQTASTAVNPGRVVTLNGSYVMADLPNTGNTGSPAFIVVNRFPSDSTVSSTNPLYGWVMASGVYAAQTSAASTTGPLYIGAAGQLTTVAAAGKQIIGAAALTAGTGTITKTGYTKNGSTQLFLSNTDGLFVGMAVSGTGIAASTTITSLDTGLNNSVLLNNAMTATGTATITFTNTGFVIARVNDAAVQTQIT